MARPKNPETRSNIVKAALRLFAQRGFHGTAVPDIAAEAAIATGTIYRYFESKEELVNAVFVYAKSMLLEHLGSDWDQELSNKELFNQLWAKLVVFARTQPVAFRFLELQDHMAYLSDESREVERKVLVPIGQAALELLATNNPHRLRIEIYMSIVWGSLVGLFKQEEMGYYVLEDEDLAAARDALFSLTQNPPVGNPE